MMKIFPIVFYFLFIHTCLVNAQSDENESLSVEVIVDKKQNIKRFDNINHQILADEKYFKNNPDQIVIKDQTPLDESLKSAELTAGLLQTIDNLIPLDQQVKAVSQNQLALDSKLKVSEEDKNGVNPVIELSNIKQLAISNESVEMFDDNYKEKQTVIAKEPIIVVDSTTVENIKSVDLTEQLEVDKSKDTTQVISKNNEVNSILKEELSVIDKVEIEKNKEVNDSLVFQEPIVKETPTKITDKYVNYKIVDEFNKKSEAPKPVEKLVEIKNDVVSDTLVSTKAVSTSPVVLEAPKQISSKPVKNTDETNEKKVIDGLIKSGMYDVYDDGKYIKISRKKSSK
jgi:hypothetical protein